MSITNEQVLIAHIASVRDGESTQTLADRLGMKVGSLNGRITGLRADLKDALIAKGLNEENAMKIVDAKIPLRGKTGPRKGARKSLIDTLLMEALTESEPDSTGSETHSES
jgi:hypothetical protein